MKNNQLRKLCCRTSITKRDQLIWLQNTRFRENSGNFYVEGLIILIIELHYSKTPFACLYGIRNRLKSSLAALV